MRYLEVQIRARSKDAITKNVGTFSAMGFRQPRENFLFIYYSEQANTYWIIPSLELIKEARQNKTGQNKERYSISLTNVAKAGVRPRPRFKKYENDFHLLEFRTDE